MKTLLVLAIALSSSYALARDITLSGSQAKSVYDTLSIEKLEGFQDGAMGKRYITIGAIDCFKTTTAEKEEMGCKFESQPGVDPLKVELKSGYGGEDYENVAQIRFVLADVTKAEVQTQAERKNLKIKALECKMAGINFVLDHINIEVDYSCKISL